MPRKKRTIVDRSPSLDSIFRPRSVAVIGAGRRRNHIGHEIVRNLVDNGFTGPVYPVNPSADVVHSMHCFPKVSAIPGKVDLAVLTVPPQHVIQAAKDCARKGVKGMVVITAGFGEIGGEGLKRQQQLVRICEKAGIRLVGPNCMGILNMEPALSMNASFAQVTPAFGGAAFMSQSGALGEAILGDASDLGLGLSMFASMGNRADVSPTDLLEYWGSDDNVTQILMYLESFGDPEAFMKVARRVTRKKPVMMVKAGRSARGAMAAMSHTGSLAGSEAAVDSLLNQCGILRVESMKDLFCLAKVAQTQKLPEGDRVAVVSNAGGPAILATDACESAALDLVDLTPRTRRALKSFVPPEASIANPVDLIATADGKSYDRALKAIIADERVDMLVTIFVSPVMIDSAAVATQIAKHAAQTDKPVVACMLGKMENEAAWDILREAGVPHYRFPEEAVRALVGLRDIKHLKDRSYDPAPRIRVKAKKGREAIEKALAAGRDRLKGTELYDLFTAYGIPLVQSRIVTNRSDALEAAEVMGYPVVAKVESLEVVHKSDTGGVILDVRTPKELMEAYTELETNFEKKGRRFKVLIQAMRSDGVETFFGAATDPKFGRLLAFGLGGIHVEVFKDVVFRLHPLTRADSEEMVSGIRGRALLEGVRGKAPVDRGQLIDILLRLSQLLDDNPEIEEIDLNPFLATPNPARSCVLDARVKLATR